MYIHTCIGLSCVGKSEQVSRLIKKAEDTSTIQQTKPYHLAIAQKQRYLTLLHDTADKFKLKRNMTLQEHGLDLDVIVRVQGQNITLREWLQSVADSIASTSILQYYYHSSTIESFLYDPFCPCA